MGVHVRIWQLTRIRLKLYNVRMKGILNRIIIILGFLTFFYVAYNKNEKFKKFVKDTKKTVENIEVDVVEEKVKRFVAKEVKKRVPETLEKVVGVVADLASSMDEDSASPRSKSSSRPSATSSKSNKKHNASGLNDRQSFILSKLEKRGELSMSDIAWDFPNVSQRTLRRDFDKLEGLGLTEQIGKTKDSKYILKNA